MAVVAAAGAAAAGGLPVVPGLSCPASAAALAGAGLGPACQAASAVTGAAGSVVGSVAGSAASQLTGFGVDSVLNALGGWVTDGATWLLAQIGTVIADTTSVDLGASWFTAHYETMMALAGVVIVPVLLLGIMQSVYRQNGSMLVRSVVVNVPLAILLTAVAVKLVQLGLAVTDAMSDAVSAGAGLDTGHFLSAVAVALSGSAAAGQPGVPAFVVFLGGLAVVFGALMVWVELLIRAAAVYVAVLFLPLALASLAWPAIAHWCRRLVDTLVALILGKFVIVAVLSLAAGALAGGVGSQPAGSASSGASGGAASSGPGGFAAVLGGAALLLLAAFAPWALFRLLPFLEAGAVGHLEGLSHRARQSVAAPAKGLALVAMRASVAGSALGAVGSVAAGSTRLAGSAASGGERGSAAPAGSGGSVGAWSGSGGGAGPQGDRPDPEPSSAELTGVGTMDPPGHGIPAWGIHPEATAAARRFMDDQPEEPVLASVPRQGLSDEGGGGVSALKPLPRQSGALRADALGRDELGVRLIATAPSLSAGPPAPRPRPTDPDGGDGH